MARIEAPFLTTPVAFADAAACDPLCDRLLTGDAVTLLRRTTVQGDRPPVTHVFRRAEPAECQRLDPDFPPAAACILMAADDGRPADLRVTVDGVGDGHASRDEVRGLACLVSSRRLQVTDLRGGAERLVHDQSSRLWVQAIAPLPLFANSGFDGNGLHGGGLAPYRERRSDPRLDPAAILAALGVPLGPGRPFVETEPARQMLSETFPPKGYFGPMPYDVALIGSALDQTTGLHDSIATLIRDWVERLERGAPNTGATRATLARLPNRLGNQTIFLQRLMTQRPELFVERFADLYPQVQSPDDDLSQLAAFAILNRVRSDPFGTHDADAEAYFAALRSRRHWDALIQIAGRYGFDPTPIFQAEIDRVQGEAYLRTLLHVQRGYSLCDAGGPRVDGHLAPGCRGGSGLTERH